MGGLRLPVVSCGWMCGWLWYHSITHEEGPDASSILLDFQSPEPRHSGPSTLKSSSDSGISL